MPQQREEHPYITPFNIAFALINVAVYIVLECLGDTNSASFMLAHGALYPPAVLIDGQWWRLLTAAFLHFGLPHLINNLILLICLGSYLERAYGRVRYVILYLVCAIGANAISLWWMDRTGDNAVSAGASGVVFGMMGALIALVLSQRGHYSELPLRRLLIMLVLCLYFGFASGGVNNAAHLGGLAVGFVLGWIYFLIGIPGRQRARRAGERGNAP